MLKPERLSAGDSVAVVSLSSGMLGDDKFIHKYEIARQRMEKLYGLKLIAMPNALRGSEYIYRHPEARAEDLMLAFSDRNIKAVFNAIGGDDSIRMLPYIDYKVLHDNPKIFTGFSDTTTVHFMMHKAGLASYYGLSLMNNWAEYVEINEYTKHAIDSMLFNPGNETQILCSEFCSYENDKIRWGTEHINDRTPRFENTGYEILQGSGKVEGELLGGCIDVFAELLGTTLWPCLDDWKGKFLLIETSEADMPPEVLGWFLRNLQAQGILNVLKAIIVGKPAFRNREAAYKEVYRKIVSQEAGLNKLPILWNVTVGHAYPGGILPLGLKYEIDCDRKTLKLTEAATE